MQRKDITRRQVLTCCKAWGTDDDMINAVKCIMEKTGCPGKLAVSVLERENNAGMISYGCSITFPWRTPEGEEWLAANPVD